MDRELIQSICCLTKAGTSVGSALIAARLITTWPVRPHARVARGAMTTTTSSSATAFRMDRIVPDWASRWVGTVRRECRDMFRKTKLLERLIPAIEEMLASGGLPVPEAPEDAQPPAFNEETSGDPGHRG